MLLSVLRITKRAHILLISLNVGARELTAGSLVTMGKDDDWLRKMLRSLAN